jgi:hypothetical protein
MISTNSLVTIRHAKSAQYLQVVLQSYFSLIIAAFIIIFFLFFFQQFEESPNRKDKFSTKEAEEFCQVSPQALIFLAWFFTSYY